MTVTTGNVGKAEEREVERSWVATLGAAAIAVVAALRELFLLFARTIYYVARGRREPGAIVAQMYEMGNRSLFFITVVMGFMGMILVYQSGLQMLRVVPDLTRLGPQFNELLVRELAATIGGLMLATRVGAGIAAEIGSMVVTEQVDALRMSAADPLDFLVKPRLLASLVMTVVLVIWGALMAFLSGMATAYVFFDVAPRTFGSLALLDVGDLVVGLTKCVAYGVAIPIVSSFCGLGAHGGSEGVGSATTRAVVSSSGCVIALDFVLSALGLLLFPG